MSGLHVDIPPVVSRRALSGRGRVVWGCCGGVGLSGNECKEPSCVGMVGDPLGALSSDDPRAALFGVQEPVTGLPFGARLWGGQPGVACIGLEENLDFGG